MLPILQGIAVQCRKLPTYESLSNGYYGPNEAARKPGGPADCVSLHYVGDETSLAAAEKRLKEYITALYRYAKGDDETGAASFNDKLTFLTSSEHETPFAIGLDAGASFSFECFRHATLRWSQSTIRLI